MAVSDFFHISFQKIASQSARGFSGKILATQCLNTIYNIRWTYE